MSNKPYAFIKNGIIINNVAFEDPTEETLSYFKNFHNVDLIIESNEKVEVGGTYDGVKFWLPQPYPSWIKNEELNKWEAPIPYPSVEEGSDEIYTWDENTTSWLLLPPSN